MIGTLIIIHLHKGGIEFLEKKWSDTTIIIEYYSGERNTRKSVHLVTERFRRGTDFYRKAQVCLHLDTISLKRYLNLGLNCLHLKLLHQHILRFFRVKF